MFDVELFGLLSALGVDAAVIGVRASDYCMGSPDAPAKRLTLVGTNADKLAQTDRTLLAVARALLSAPDVLLLAGTLDLLGPAKAVVALGVLKDWVKNRCVSFLETENSDSAAALRGPKTLIVSTKLKEVEGLADNWLMISGRK